MCGERHSLGGSLHDDPRSLQSSDSTDEASQPAEGSRALAARAFVLACLIPSGPATGLAISPPMQRRAVS
jgi:hypothetical protein